MKKKFVTMALASVLTIGNIFPAFALNVSDYYNMDSTEIKTTFQDDMEYRFASGKKADDHWRWVNGYCYYFHDKNGLEMVTNCTTPDGYTVNELGQWTIDGVPQYNGFQNLVVGTDEKYAGKSDDERWIEMRSMLETLFAENTACNSWSVAMVSTKNRVDWQWPNGAGIGHNNLNGDYISATFGNGWNECLGYNVSNWSETMERTLRILCGDHAGIELFNALHAAALPAEGGPRNFLLYDENGNPTYHVGEDGLVHGDVVSVEISGDGVNFNYLDKKWMTGEMKTDYGKSIVIEPSWKIHDDKPTKTPIEWTLNIK